MVALLLFERFESIRRDLGLYRALGYTRREVALSLLWESFLLGTVGISVGMVLERLLSLVIRLDWVPIWVTHPLWPSIPLMLLWGATLLAVLLIPVIPVIRLYRWEGRESLAAY